MEAQREGHVIPEAPLVKPRRVKQREKRRTHRRARWRCLIGRRRPGFRIFREDLRGSKRL